MTITDAAAPAIIIYDFFSLVLTSPRPSVRSRRRAYTQGQMTGGGGGGSAAL